MRWHHAALLALLCSSVAVAAIPGSAPEHAPELQWEALGIAPLGSGGATGIRQAPGVAANPIEIAPERPTIELQLVATPREPLAALLVRSGASWRDAASAAAMLKTAPAAGTPVMVVLGARNGGTRPIERVTYRAGLALKLELSRGGGGGRGALRLLRKPIAIDTTPLRVRGRAGAGLYWSLRSAGASPQAAAEYLKALAAEIDVGSEIGPDDIFDLVIANRRAATGERQMGPLLLAAIDRRGAGDVQLVRWRSAGKIAWIETGSIGQAHSQTSGMSWPVAARITSGFGPRIHPILRFARMHRGIDFGARWGSPIVAAADGQVTAAGWAGGYGRQVRIAHSGGTATSYSHMSSMAVAPGTHVRQGQLIGYVGSSGMSTGPHLHYEVHRGGRAVNPLGVRFASAPVLDDAEVAAFKARLKMLLAVGVRG
jgi:hypothetical protein